MLGYTSKQNVKLKAKGWLQEMRLKKWLYTVEARAGRLAEKEAPFFERDLSAVRRGKGLTQQQLLDKLGIKRPAGSHYETRSLNPALILPERFPAAFQRRSPNYWQSA
ncbi:MAG: hypothetical protein IPO41_13750 [Acidobacteria bacterium]|nr:hypothetical protein [Acidobacteriota bacterium]